MDVWNPAEDPDRTDRWALVRYPRYTLHRGDLQTEYNMYVYQDEHLNLYFSANDVAWCLGYEAAPPHKVVEKHVPPQDLHTLSYATGQFMTVDGVRRFLDRTHGRDEVRFRDWFEKYVTECENKVNTSPFSTCPS